MCHSLDNDTAQLTTYLGDFVYQRDLLRALEYYFIFPQTENDVNYLSNWHFFLPISLLYGSPHVEPPSLSIFQKRFSLIY